VEKHDKDKGDNDLVELNIFPSFSNTNASIAPYPPSSPFFISIPVTNLKLATQFYGDTLGLKKGHSSDK